MNLEFVKRHLDKNWDRNQISSNPNITIDDIEQNSDLPWKWKYVSNNPNITMAFIESHFDKEWNLETISENKFTYTFKSYFYQNRRREQISRFKGVIPVIEDLESIILNYAIAYNVI